MRFSNTPVSVCEDNLALGRAVVLEFYYSNTSSRNNKITLTYNLLSLVNTGNKKIIGPNKSQDIDNEKIFLLQAGNTLMSEKTTNNTFKSILLFFSNEFLIDFVLKNDIKVEKIENNIVGTELVVIAKDEYLTNFEQSLLFLKEAIEKDKNLLETKTKEVLHYLWLKKPSLLLPFIKNALQKTETNSFRKNIIKYEVSGLTIDELAFLNNMSIATFKRKFNETFKIAPKRYFTKKRMEKALIELHKKRRPTDFFEELGYTSLSTFTKEFKKHYGLPPKQYQNKIDPK